jgi:hypothetical protein
MLFGGWLYPDAPSTGAAGAKAALNKDKVVCAAMGPDVAQATSAPAKKQFKMFRTGINCLHFHSQHEPTDKTILQAFG